ncbi:HAMP domain-containing protein [Ornithinibacillus sp. L9]|uniref:Signal transduction histidine-protein kinase ArlS n=1 Tax=Ornithinibacillus caprae TaxID=2678566 RepID=A0A6N8FLY4_9BACI|nr:HAMP domain-containing histidine kinase [Ornithinibacillus caprae]MUK89736.1 HAMP domain-containing protein [Ornithinibacillus caprae]
MKLKTKIQLFSSLFMLVLILIINTSIYFLFYKLSADNELEELASHTNTIITSLNSNPEIAKNDLLKAFLPMDGMIRVIPKEGEPLAHTKDRDYFNLPGEYSVAESQTIINQQGEWFAVISKPIIWGDGEILTLQVSKHLINLTETMKVLLYVLVVASIIILIPTVIAGNVLSRFLLSPIKAFIQTMNANAKHAEWEKIDRNSKSKDELYEMTKAYNDMIDKLKEAYEKQEIFVSDASHELKTPISIVKSYAQLMEKRGLANPELFKESVEAINSEADRMQKLVEQMLALAKNKGEHHNEQVDIVSKCKEAVASFIGAYNREIDLDYTDDAVYVKGNADQLQQIMYILIDNALKYSEDKVHVRIRKEEGNTILSVTDYGQGIPVHEQSRIFDRFYRVDKARSRDTGGTGLGLSIARTIALSHKGTLTLKSKVGEGSTFTLKLPL